MIIWMDQLLANYHPDGPATCKWSSWWTGSCKWSFGLASLLQMIIWMDQLLTNDHLDGLASCKWSSWLTCVLQMIILIDGPLTNDHLDWPASCKWSFWSTGLLQMNILMDRPLANDYPDGSAPCKWSSGWAGLLQMIILFDQPRLDRQALLQFWGVCILKKIYFLRLQFEREYIFWPHQDVQSRKKSVGPVHGSKVIEWFLCLCFNIISLQNQV